MCKKDLKYVLTKKVENRVDLINLKVQIFINYNLFLLFPGPITVELILEVAQWSNVKLILFP